MRVRIHISDKKAYRTGSYYSTALKQLLFLLTADLNSSFSINNRIFICFIMFLLSGGPILTRAAWYTAGMVGGLSTVAACAPSDKFLTWGGPLAMGLGVVFCASLGTMFLPPTTALGSGQFSMPLNRFCGLGLS